jgi:hypothetical protein
MTVDPRDDITELVSIAIAAAVTAISKLLEEKTTELVQPAPIKEREGLVMTQVGGRTIKVSFHIMQESPLQPPEPGGHSDPGGNARTR